jgi:hypothetical protein
MRLERTDARLLDESLDFGGIEPDEVADFHVSDASLADEPSDETSVDAEASSYLGAIDEGSVCAGGGRHSGAPCESRRYFVTQVRNDGSQHIPHPPGQPSAAVTARNDTPTTRMLTRAICCSYPPTCFVG